MKLKIFKTLLKHYQGDLSTQQTVANIFCKLITTHLCHFEDPAYTQNCPSAFYLNPQHQQALAAINQASTNWLQTAPRMPKLSKPLIYSSTHKIDSHFGTHLSTYRHKWTGMGIASYLLPKLTSQKLSNGPSFLPTNPLPRAPSSALTSPALQLSQIS